MTIAQLIKDIQHRSFTGNPSAVICGVTRDTREVKQGSVFVCIRGAHIDGHDLAAQAVEAGAALVIAERETGSGAAELLVETQNRRWRKRLCVLWASVTHIEGHWRDRYKRKNHHFPSDEKHFGNGRKKGRADWYRRHYHWR